MSLINNRDGVHFDSQFSSHVRLNIMRHKSSAPNRATLIRCKTTLGFLLTVLTFGKPLKGTFMSRGWLSPTSLMLHENHSFNYLCTGIFLFCSWFFICPIIALICALVGFSILYIMFLGYSSWILVIHSESQFSSTNPVGSRRKSRLLTSLWSLSVGIAMILRISDGFLVVFGGILLY